MSFSEDVKNHFACETLRSKLQRSNSPKYDCLIWGEMNRLYQS